MGIASHFLHTCDIQRGIRTTDALRAEKVVYKPWASDIACRLVVKSQRVIDTVTAEAAIVTSYMLLLPAGTDVRPSDQVRVQGDQNTFRIEAVLPRNTRFQHHISVQLERISATRPQGETP